MRENERTREFRCSPEQQLSGIRSWTQPVPAFPSPNTSCSKRSFANVAKMPLRRPMRELRESPISLPGIIMADAAPRELTDSYKRLLLENYNGIREIWLFGSRASENPRSTSDWDLLVFADNATLQLMKEDSRLQSSTYDLFVVYDEDSFVQPWGETPKAGSLSGWEWAQKSPHEAEYKATHPSKDPNKAADVSKGKACRLWPD